MKKKERKMVQRLIHDYVTTVRGWFCGTPSDKIITQSVIMATLSQNPEGLDDAEIKRIAAWAEETHYKFSILGRVINNEVCIRFFEGDSEPKMAYTPYGQECAKRRENYEEDARRHFG
jgi:hypothetical protein